MSQEHTLNYFSLVGLIVEGVGFVIIWITGGLDGALNRAQVETKELEKNISRLKEMEILFQKSNFGQTISTGSNGAPNMGFSMHNNNLGIYLTGEIQRDTNRLDVLNKEDRARKFKRVYEEGKGTTIGFFLVILGLILQVWSLF